MPPTIAPKRLDASAFAGLFALERETEKIIPAKKMGSDIKADAAISLKGVGKTEKRLRETTVDPPSVTKSAR